MEIFILSLLLTFFENYYRPQVTRHPTLNGTIDSHNKLYNGI